MLDFIKDIFSSLRQNSLERIRSPFLGAFVFSWLGFNWQLLAILALSEKDILTRLDYINDNFDIGKLLLAPVFTTALICIILPNANKLVTKLQRKTNHDTNEIILQSKIDIAAKQLQLADFEARKKLSEEREKKNIDADISAIFSKLDDTTTELNELKRKNIEKEKDIATLLAHENHSKDQIDELELKLKLASDDNIELKNRLEIQGREWNSELVNHEKTKVDLSKALEDSLKMSLNLNDITDEKYKLLGEVKSLKDQNESLKNDIIRLSKDSAKVFSSNNFINSSMKLKNEAMLKNEMKLMSEKPHQHNLSNNTANALIAIREATNKLSSSEKSTILNLIKNTPLQTDISESTFSEKSQPEGE